MKSKRGSHVGMVISFVVFITAIVLLYVIIQPTFGADTRNSLSNYLQNEIIEQTSSELKSSSISISKTNPQACVQLVDFFVGTDFGNRIIVLDENENVLNARISNDGDDLYVQKDTGDSFIKVHESNEFALAEVGSFGACSITLEDPTGYTKGLTKTTKHVFETKVTKLLEDYNSDYDQTKETLGISQSGEFGFGFEYNNKTVIETNTETVQTNIFVDEFPVQYINKNAAAKTGSLIIKVW